MNILSMILVFIACIVKMIWRKFLNMDVLVCIRIKNMGIRGSLGYRLGRKVLVLRLLWRLLWIKWRGKRKGNFHGRCFKGYLRKLFRNSILIISSNFLSYLWNLATRFIPMLKNIEIILNITEFGDLQSQPILLLTLSLEIRKI